MNRTSITETQILDDAEMIFLDMPEQGDTDASRKELQRLELPIWAQEQLDEYQLQGR